MAEENDRETLDTGIAAEVRNVREAFVSVGLVEEPVPPSGELRSRLAATLRELPSKR